MTLTLPKISFWFVGASLAGLFIHAIIYLPITYSDQFQDIQASMTRNFGNFLEHWDPDGVLFRPGEVVMRFSIVSFFGNKLFSYNIFQIIFIILTAIGLISLVPCNSWLDAGAGITALLFFFGHHAFVASTEGHIVISNGVILLFMFVVLNIVQSSGNIATQLVAVIISILAVLIKEVGLIVPFTLIVSAFLGFSGVRKTTAGVLILLIMLYVGYRGYTLPPFEAGSIGAASPTGLMERFWNIVFTPVMFVTGEPFDGKWTDFLRRRFYPWRIIRIALGIATVALIATAFCLRRPAQKTFPENELVDEKWLLLIVAVLAASAAIAFQYTRHRFGAMALPVAFLLVNRSVRIVLWRISTLNFRAVAWGAAVAGVMMLAVGWASRAADGFIVIRYTGAKTMVDWIEHYEKYSAHEAKRSPQLLPYLDSFFWAAEEKPWPTIQHDPSFVRFWLGDEDVMNR